MGRPIHGMTKTRTFKSWDSMKQRCMNPNDPSYLDYGGRGITICDRWDLFMNFYEDMGERPDNHTLDRIDVNGNYEPNNCKWPTSMEQNNNRRNNLRVEINGVIRTQAQWCRIYGIQKNTVLLRKAKGMSIVDSITTPSQRY